MDFFFCKNFAKKKNHVKSEKTLEVAKRNSPLLKRIVTYYRIFCQEISNKIYTKPGCPRCHFNAAMVSGIILLSIPAALKARAASLMVLPDPI